MKRILSILLALTMCISMTATVFAEEMKFTDVKTSDWFYDDVKTAVESGLVNGKSATTYAPNDNLTYAEAIKLAACMHQLYNEGAITLASGNPWYKPYVDYCIDEEIIDKEYNYEDFATRAGYMGIFAKALSDEGLEAINNVPDNSIPDVPSSRAYAAGVYKLYRAGILTGVDDAHNCNPLANITRAEVAAILTRMMNESKRVKFSMGTDSGLGSGSGESTTPETEPLTIKTQPAGSTVELGAKAETSIKAAGGKKPYKYQWQILAVAPGGVETWFNISDNPNFSGETSDTLYSGITTAGEKKVRCLVTDANGDKVISKEATLVFTEEEVPLTVSVSEKDLTVEAGSSATLTVKGEGGKAPYTYQWEIATTDGKWTEISDNPFFSGATNSSMKVALTEETTEKFRCVITDAKGKEAISEEITLNVKEIPAQPLSITAQPANITDAALGDYVSFTFSVSGGKAPIKYQWQQKISSASDFKNLTAESTGTMANEGFDTSTLTVKVTNVGSDRYQYRCIVTDADGNSVTTNAASYKIGSTVKALAVKTQPTAIEIAVGESGTLSVEAEGGSAPYTYQWQLSTGGTTYQNVGDNAYISGVKTNTITLQESKPLRAYFRCVITDANGDTVTSQGVTVTVVEAVVPLQIKTNPTGGTGKVAFNAKLTAEATGGKTPYTYQWQTKIGTRWENISDNAMLSGTQSKTLTFKPLSTGTVEFRCVITDANGNSVTSKPATVVVVN